MVQHPSQAQRDARHVDQAVTTPPAVALTSDNSALWNLPGLGKTNFYAAALYLHVSARGQLRFMAQKDYNTRTWTKPDVRDFLDRLADCFARSKSANSQAHVSATAMVLEEKQKKIKIYVAKNLVGENMGPSIVVDAVDGSRRNDDNALASELCDWFNVISSEAQGTTRNRELMEDRMWNILFTYNASRLEHYVHKIKCWDDNVFTDSPLWPVVDSVLQACKRQRTDPNDLNLLSECARIASQCRSNDLIVEFSQKIDGLLHGDDIDKNIQNFARLVKWINYLGRLGAALSTFSDFCIAPTRQGYRYEIIVLPSPKEQSWPADTYINAIQSWSGNLGLDDQHRGNTSRQSLRLFRDKAGSRGTARVHCEIQLLNHFTFRTSEKCQDYIGCSKKSCWLCWQILLYVGHYATKGTHRMIYPMWAFPADIPSTHTGFAEALNSTYKDMMALIYERVLLGRDFSLRENITHTSLRLNPVRSIQAAPFISEYDAAVTLDYNPENLVSPETMISQGRLPVAKVPCIHLPVARTSNGKPQPRLVDLDVFEKDWSDPNEQWMDHFQFGDKQILFAFQLNTKVDEHRVFGFDELETIVWSVDLLREHDLIPSSVMFYRRDGDLLPRNPWMLDTVRHFHGDDIDVDAVPWCGDVFVAFASRIAGPATYDTKLYTDANKDHLDLPAYLAMLRGIIQADADYHRRSIINSNARLNEVVAMVGKRIDEVLMSAGADENTRRHVINRKERVEKFAAVRRGTASSLGSGSEGSSRAS